MLFDQKEHLQQQVDRIEAEKGGPTTYTKLLRRQIAGFDDVPLDDKDFYSGSIASRGDSEDD
jgi:hypothetical protein